MSKYSGKLGDLYQTYSRLVSQWPVDKLRPTHCYKNSLKQHMVSNFGRISALRGESVNQELIKVERELASLNNMLKSKHKTHYAISEDLKDPISNKGYYTKLLSSIDDAIKSKKATSLRVD
ncbi:hypothetical protein IW140_004124 [Coemansia sp. RSA 1813]|nr:hypothetical protein EV178_004176 [Coemansia sp. RSA 1646]KAJ1770963.1 hypothetical protein LPJ74_002763 [Coemansia sp. RSA 1843]KAJ2088283.1 hypothetical protein IW138_004360 [Coemansia sp. RSA 986]KAJ2213292.1 hypothetical protein EV179_003984 [Coemansia sp. RSA 487]KAJ2568127.1 hypothetical protein IW140_004124 [Coemansia sp. RSA 1813]